MKPGVFYLNDTMRIVDRSDGSNTEKILRLMALSELLGASVGQLAHTYAEEDSGPPSITVFVEKKLPGWAREPSEEKKAPPSGGRAPKQPAEVWYRAGRIDWRYDNQPNMNTAVPVLSYGTKILSPADLKTVTNAASRIYNNPGDSSSWGLSSHCVLCSHLLKNKNSIARLLGRECSKFVEGDENSAEWVLKDIAKRSKSLTDNFRVEVDRRKHRAKQRKHKAFVAHVLQPEEHSR